MPQMAVCVALGPASEADVFRFLEVIESHIIFALL